MLLSVAVLFSSCSGKEKWEPKVSKKVVDVDLTEYTVVYDTALSSGCVNETNAMVTKLIELSGVRFRADKDTESEEVETADSEILIGETYRTETAKAMKGIKGEGWTIRVFDNKIVIVGTTPFLTRVALAYFSRNYVTKDAIKDKVISINQKVSASKMGMTELAEDGAGKYTVVYGTQVDATDNGGPDRYDYAADANPTTGGPDADKIFEYSRQVQSLLAKSTGTTARNFPFKLSDAEATQFEVLVGNMNREDYKAELRKLEVNEYGISIRDGKIMILAWNDVTLESAYSLFSEMIADSGEEDDEGNVICRIPMNCDIVVPMNTKWVTDFPKPDGEGIALDGTLDVADSYTGDNSLEYIYTGDGVSRESYVAYCDKLEAAGYKTIVAENFIEDNSFRTYVNEEEGITLHVYHSAYKYASQYGITSVLPSIRIIAASTDCVTLPGDDILKATTYDRITDSKITQLKLNYSLESFGNSYVITLADGSFIVYDGGLGLGGETDLNNIWNTLNTLAACRSDNKIHIRAWLMSHEHADHLNIFNQFVNKYGKNSRVQLDAFLFNPVSASERHNSNNPSTALQSAMKSLQSKVTGGFEFIKVHTGQIFYFANLKLEILYTHEDSYPKRLEYFNNSSTIFRTTFVDTKETMIWLGDSERIGGNNILAFYGPTLDSDMVQVAHHGWNGVTKQTYDVIAPEVVWWPTQMSTFKSWSGNENAKNWFHRVDHAIANKVTSVELILIADIYNTTMTFTGSKSDYDTLIDLATGNAVTYCKLSAKTTSVIDKRLS